jgi:hypothetical protein
MSISRIMSSVALLTLHFFATTCPAGRLPCIGCLLAALDSDNSGVVSSEVNAAMPLCKLESTTVPAICARAFVVDAIPKRFECMILESAMSTTAP